MLPSCSAITWAICASVPGSLTDCTAIRAGKRCGRALVDVPAHVEPALRRVLEVLQRRRLDRIDRDALARRQDADDAVARHRAAVRREAHRQIAVDAADRDRAAVCSAVRHLEHHRLALLQPEPAALGLRRRHRARRALPCSRDTSRARRRRPASRRGRPRPARPRSRRAPAAAARRCSFSSEYSLLGALEQRARRCAGRAPHIACARRRGSRGGSPRAPCR